MFLKEALLRCSRLEEDAAAIYAGLAELPATAPDSAAAWSDCARLEEKRSGLLRALAGLSEALDDEGPFLVQVPVQLAAFERAVAGARRGLEQAADASAAARVAELLDSAPGRDLHASLLEVVEPEARRVVRLIASEIRSTRRCAGGKPRARDEARNRAACSNPTN